MSSDQELASEISRQLQRLSAQLQEHQRDLQKRGNTDGQPLVQSARGAAERLLGRVQGVRVQGSAGNVEGGHGNE